MKTNVVILFCLLSIVIACDASGNRFIGEYEGILGGHSVKAFVLAYSGQQYKINVFALYDSLVPGGFELAATVFDDSLCIMGQATGRSWNGRIQNDVMTLNAHYYDLSGELKKVERKSPTLGQKPPAEAIVLLLYEHGKKTNLEQWTNKKWILLDDGSVQVKTGNNHTTKHFRNVKLHVEFYLPLEPSNTGQNRANSGIFFNDYSYEVQILDSFGLIPSVGDCGSIYGIKAPSVNASLSPEQWQTYDITFRTPVMDKNGKIKIKPRITAVHNGVLIHEDVEIPRSTISQEYPQKASGPIHLQDHGSAVRYRNIWAVEMD